MALFWMDGFDHYDGVVGNLSLGAYADVQNKTISTARSRTGSYSLAGAVSAASSYIQKNFPTNKQTVGIGFSIFFETAHGQVDLVEFSSALGSFSSSGQGQFRILSTGAIDYRLGGGIQASTNPGLFALNVWNHVEIKISIANTGGTVHIRVNGVEVMAFTGDTYYGSSGQYSQGVRIFNGQTTGGNASYLDDLFMYDGDGTYNNTFIGDRKVVLTNPNDVTSVAEWAVSGAANAVTAISSNNGDTSFISAGSSTPVTSEFELSNLDSTVGGIAGVQTVICARKTDAGTVFVQPSLISGSSSSNGSNNHTITDSYAYHGMIHEVNPATGVPWTVSTFNTAKMRVRRV